MRCDSRWQSCDDDLPLPVFFLDLFLLLLPPPPSPGAAFEELRLTVSELLLLDALQVTSKTTAASATVVETRATVRLIY